MFGWLKKKKQSASEPLNYDTQIELVFSPELFVDPVIAPLLKQVGIEMEMQGNKVMLFTDIRTVAALNADPKAKEIAKQSGIGTTLYGWNNEQRTAFLKRELTDISNKYADNDEALLVAVFDLHRFVSNGLLGQIDPNPFASPLPSLRPSEKFDQAAAIESMLSPEQMSKPKAPPTNVPR